MLAHHTLRWLLNIIFIWVTFKVFWVAVQGIGGPVDDATVAALLAIALSDLYLGRGRK